MLRRFPDAYGHTDSGNLCLALPFPRRNMDHGAQIRRAGAPVFIVWAALAALNGWIGFARAGYSLMEETLVFLCVSGVPAFLAVLLSRRVEMLTATEPQDRASGLLISRAWASEGLVAISKAHRVSFSWWYSPVPKGGQGVRRAH